MEQFFSLFTFIIPLISGLITFILFIRTYKEKSQNGIKYFSAIMLGCTIYSTAYFFEILSSSLSVSIIFLYIQQISAFFIAPFTLLFITRFLKKNHLSKLLEKIVFILPALFVVGLLSNNFHHLYYESIQEVDIYNSIVTNSEKNILYWVHNFYSIFLTFVSSFLLFIFILGAPTLYVTSLLLILFSINIGLLSVFFTTFDFININYDVLPLTFLISGTILYYTLSNYDVFKTIPLNFKRILNSLNKGIIIINSEDTIVYFNELSTKILFDKVKRNITITEIKSKYPQILDETNQKFKILKENKDGKIKSIQIEVSSLNSANEKGNRDDIKVIYIEDISNIEEINIEYSKTQHENKLFFNNAFYGALSFNLNPSIIWENEKHSFNFKTFIDENLELKRYNKTFLDTVHLKDDQVDIKKCIKQILLNINNVETSYSKLFENNKLQVQSTIYFENRKKIHLNLYFETLVNENKEVFGILLIVKDITRELRSEKELQKSNERYKLALKSSSDGIWEWYPQKRKSYFSRRWKEQLGYSNEELENNSDTFRNLLHPEDLNRVLKYQTRYLHNEIDKYEIEFRLRHKDGTYRVINSVGASVRDENGKVLRTVGFHKDITEQRKYEASIQKAKRSLLRTSKIAKIGGWEYDIEKDELMWSSITKEIHGVEKNYKPDTKTAINFYKEGKDRERIKTLFENLLNNKESYDEELLIITKDGQEKWVRSVGLPYIENGKFNKVIGSFQDIHELKLNQEKLTLINQELLNKEEILKAIADSTNILLVNHDIEYAIDKSLELLGKACKVDRSYFFSSKVDEHGDYYIKYENEWCLEKGTEEINNPDLQNIPLGVYEEAAVLLLNNKVFQAKVSELKFENLKELLSNQNIKSILLIPIFIKNEFVGLVGFDDIKKERSWIEAERNILNSFALSIANAIERSELENNLLEAKNKAEKASLSKSEFLANMSHEIRTPMNGIIGFTDILLKSEVNKEQKEYLTIVQKSGNMLLSIINDILDFSKIEAGKMELNFGVFDLQSAIKSLIEIQKVQADNNNNKLIFEFDKAINYKVKTDEVRLKQVIMNLISNAIKFTNNGLIKIKVEIINKEDNRIRFSVKDNGIGIKSEQQKMIFNAFVQEDSSISKRFGGTGLGLSISCRILKLMNSEIKLESEFGKGSNFYFDLVLQPVVYEINDDNLEIEKNIEKSNLVEIKAIKTVKSLLIVEDNELNMYLAKLIINNIDDKIKILEARDGLEAVDICKENNEIDLILMDIQMPKMDGIEATTEIRKLEDYRSKPIVALSAGIIDSEKNKCFEAGMNLFISKPINQEDLKELILDYENI